MPHTPGTLRTPPQTARRSPAASAQRGRRTGDIRVYRGFRGLRGYRGFTLIELLVVVVIILLLLSILLPSMGRAIVIAQRTKCASNLHQQGIGMISYVAEHRVFPKHVGTSASGGWMPAWPSRVRKYSNGDRGIFYCPSQMEGWVWQELYGTGPGYATAYDVANLGYRLGEKMLTLHSTPFSYGINDWGACGAFCQGGLLGLGGDPSWPFVSFSLVQAPSKMIAIGDNTTDGSWDFNIDPTNPREYPGKIHDEGCNLVYVDGHVRWSLQSEVILTPNWPPAAWDAANLEICKQWNTTHQRTQ